MIAQNRRDGWLHSISNLLKELFMKKLGAALTAATLLGMGAFALANDDMHGKDTMKAMDSNGDGMISKDEYMSYHQKKWDSMKKDANGMVDMKSMSMMHDKKMHDGNMDSDSSMPKPQ